MVYQNSSALLAKRNTGMDTRHESEQAQPIDPRGSAYSNAEKKFTPWKMPEFVKEDLTGLYHDELPDDWKLFRVTVQVPYKNFTKEIYHLVEASGKCWVVYSDDEMNSRADWLRDNESFIGYRG